MRPTALRAAMERAQLMPSFEASEKNPLFRRLRHALQSKLGYVGSTRRGH